MTVAQLIDSLNLSPILKTLVKGYAVAHYPDVMGKVVSIAMDSDTGVVTVCLDGQPFFSKTFEDIEAFVNGPQKEQPDSGSTPEQPLDEAAPVDAGGAAGPAGLPG